MTKAKRDYHAEQERMYNYCNWCNKKKIYKGDLTVDMAIPYHKDCLELKEKEENRHKKNQRDIANIEYRRQLRLHKGLRG